MWNSYFTDNFYEFYGKDIRERDEFLTVMPNAKMPLISVEDIAKLAVKVFLAEKNDRNEQRIIGPELVTYDQARHPFCSHIPNLTPFPLGRASLV